MQPTLEGHEPPTGTSAVELLGVSGAAAFLPARRAAGAHRVDALRAQ